MSRDTSSTEIRFARTPPALAAIAIAVTFCAGWLASHWIAGASLVPLVAVVTLAVLFGAWRRYPPEWRPRWRGQRLVERVRDGNQTLSIIYFVGVLGAPVIAAIFTGLGLSGADFGKALVASVFIVVCLACAAFGPEHLAADDTGIYLQRVYGWLFVPWKSVDTITLSKEKGWLFVRTKDAEVLPMRLASNSIGNPSTLLDKLAALRPRSGNFDPSDARFAALDRNGRDRERWLSDVRALVAESPFRAASVTLDELGLLLAHDETPDDRRIAAAAALAATDPSAPEKIRVAISASDDRSVREALVAIADAARDSVQQKR